MYTPDGSIAKDDHPANLDLAPQFGLQLIDGAICGDTSTPGEFEEDPYTRGAPHCPPVMVGLSAQRRAAGRDVVFGLEDEASVDVLALEYGVTQRAVVLA